MSISLDITFIIQLVNFLVSVFIINALIIKPIRTNMAKRKAIVDQDKNAAEKFRSQIETQNLQYDERLNAIRIEIAKQRETIKASAEEVAHSALQEANEKARSLRQDSTQKVQSESREVMNALQNKISAFTEEALTKILV